tara:strand:- start:34473 stop:38996 length:4524 start_codon:yes stop_codon:yes gene_type:complete
MKYILSFFLSAFLFNLGFSQNQDWVDQMQDPSVNFYTVQQSFEEAWKEKSYEKGKGWKQFKRWEAFMAERVFPDGVRPNPSVLSQAFNAVQQAQSTTNGGNWVAKGPFNGSPIGGIGRINRITFDPNNSTIVWAGAPAGGLWKSTDGGTSWSSNTDLLPNLGVSDIAIDPNNSQIMYLATGDRDGGNTYSYGVLKSIDGGQTWNTTGLVHNVSNMNRISDIYINPNNTNIIVVSTRQGIYRSTNAAASFTQVQSGVFNSIEQKPGDPNILYTSTIINASSDIWKSINNGISWTQISSSNIPTSGIRRFELAVTADDPDYVYAIAGNASNGFEGIYKSTNSGLTWTKTTNSSSPNLLGWRANGSDSGGQAWYDLALAVSPTNKDILYTGGVNIWRSTDGGNNWSISAHWTGSGSAAFVHADIHHLIFNPDGRLYAGTDGGVYRRPSSNNNWVSLNDGMNITQYYRISADGIDTSLVAAGAQDNGTHLYDNGTWDHILGGDGMDCAVNPKNPSIIYASSQYGNFRKSNNRGNSFNANFGLSSNVRGTGAWVTPIRVDPIHPDTLYIGYSSVYRSFDGGNNFSAVGNGYNGNNIDQIAISPTHTHVIYIADGGSLYRSDNYASNFSSLAAPGSGSITQIAVGYDDPMHVYITRSGYSSGQKVYESFDGGGSWNNISLNLPNIPANCIVPEISQANGLYVGTDLGVFYKDDNMDNWVPFNSGLPNVIVNDLEINYQDRKLKAGTYGRGLWQSPLYTDISAPLADFNIPSSVCDGDTIKLFENSFYNANSWTWNISPSDFTFVNGTNANSPNPEIIFTKSAIFNVELTVSNAFGSDSKSISSAIAVGGFPLPFSEDFEAVQSMDKWDIGDSTLHNWRREFVGGNSPGSHAARAFLFNHTAGPYSLISPSLDFRNHDSIKLSYDYAYSGRVINSDDTLKIYIATNCSDNWILLKTHAEDGSNNFRTQNPTNFIFSPNSSADWCSNPGFGDCGFIDLSAYDNTEGVRLKFEAISAGGNNLFLDNIQITGDPNTAPLSGFSGSQMVCAQDTIDFLDQSYGSPTSYEWTFPGASPSASTDKNPRVVYTQAGVYDVSLKVSSALGSDSIMKLAYTVVDPADSVSINLLANANIICPNDTFVVSINAINQGISPAINWYVNGSLYSANSSSTYRFVGLNDGDEIYASLASSMDCAFPSLAYSDTLTLNTYPILNVQITPPGNLCVTDPSITLTASPAGGNFVGFGLTDSIFDPAAAGVGNHSVSYEYTDANGCTFTDQVTITVDVPPSISIGSAPVVCEGEGLFFLNIASPAGGVFSGPGVRQNFFFPDSAGLGTHKIYYTFQAGNCAAVVDSTTISVVANPSQPSIIYQANSLVCNQTGFSYQWFRNGVSIVGANSINYSPINSGNFRVEIINQEGCSTISDDFVFNIGLDEFQNAISFDLYPNPADKEITLEIEAQSAPKAQIRISNAIGQVLMEIPLEQSTHIIQKVDLSNLSGGAYIISVKGDNINISKKLLVQ